MAPLSCRDSDPNPSTARILIITRGPGESTTTPSSRTVPVVLTSAPDGGLILAPSRTAAA